MFRGYGYNTSPSHQDEENFQVTLKKRMHHCLDRHACKNKLHSLALPTIAQTKGENGYRNLEHEHYISQLSDKQKRNDNDAKLRT
jgi:hypothetical protein